MMMLMVRYQEQKMLMVGDPGQDGAGWCQSARDSIMPPRMAHNFIFMAYFWNFPFNIFRLQFTRDNQNRRKQNCG